MHACYEAIDCRIAAGVELVGLLGQLLAARPTSAGGCSKRTTKIRNKLLVAKNTGIQCNDDDNQQVE